MKLMFRFWKDRVAESRMRLKVTLSDGKKEPQHTDLAVAVDWASSDELFSCGEDHQIIVWNQASGEARKFSTLPQDVFPTDIHWLPSAGAAISSVGAGPGRKGGSSSDLFILSSSDGKIYLITKNGRVEKCLDHHKGATIVVRWSHDGGNFASGSEDGSIKLFSRSGQLRSNLVQSSTPIYSLAWSADNDQILYASDRMLNIKPLQPNSKASSWRAHDGVILKVDWNVSTGLIVSAGEDCRYKIWDSFGRQMFSSATHEYGRLMTLGDWPVRFERSYPITSVAWSPDGQLLAVGSYQTLRLCDKAGWSHCLEKPAVGSLLALAWAPDSTQFAASCANGQIITSYVVDRKFNYRHWEATVTDQRQMQVVDVANDVRDKLDFRDRVTCCSFAHNYLIAITTAQCYVYSTRNLNTPAIFDLKDQNVLAVVQSRKLFALVHPSAVLVYSYEGRMVSQPKLPANRASSLNSATLSLSDDTLAFVDKSSIHMVDATNGRPVGDGKPFDQPAGLPIQQVALDNSGPPNERHLAFVDKNKELFLTLVRIFGSHRPLHKLGNMIHSIEWNDASNILCGLSDSKIRIWYYPAVVFSDKDLLPLTVRELNSSELGRQLELTSFVGQVVNFKRHDGSQVALNMSPYYAALHGHVAQNKWPAAVDLCRFVKDERLWACLAAMGAHAKNLPTAEVAYAAIEKADKVYYLKRIQLLKNEQARLAELELFNNNLADAERILLQANLVFKAIMLNIQVYNWDRALELALAHKTHIDTVIAYRHRYLAQLGRDENSPNFLQYSKGVDFDWDRVQQKVAAEKELLGEI